MLNIVCFNWKPQPNQQTSIPSQVRNGEMAAPYTSWDVNNMRRMLKKHTTVPFRFVCFTDDPSGLDFDVVALPMWQDHRERGGCFTRLRVFSEEMREMVGERLLCIDLDTVVVGNIDHILSRTEDFVYYRWEGKVGEASRFNCGLYMMNAGARKAVWTEFDKYTDLAVAAIKASHHVGTDQAWCNLALDLREESYFGRRDGIYDMRVDVMSRPTMNLPPNARMVTFPGPRDPKDARFQGLDWIKEHYYGN